MTPTPPVQEKDYVDWSSGELLAMAALDVYPIDDGLPKSTSVVFRIHQLGRALASETQARQEVEGVLVAHGRLDGTTQADRVKWLALDHEKVSELLQQSTERLTAERVARQQAERSQQLALTDAADAVIQMLAQQEKLEQAEHVQTLHAAQKRAYEQNMQQLLEQLEASDQSLASLRTALAPTTLTCAAHMLRACADQIERLAIGYGSEQMRGIAARLDDAAGAVLIELGLAAQRTDETTP